MAYHKLTYTFVNGITGRSRTGTFEVDDMAAHRQLRQEIEASLRIVFEMLDREDFLWHKEELRK